ncbi:MAG: TrkH family potassium uptake protein [Tannerella sp.]|jgi:trk system potassium uptake protein TrkH|nr:TrkH family potassium uptake protein [Tannerella sp.]
MFQLNMRFVFKMLGLMHVIESFFVLCATGVAFYYGGDDRGPLLASFAIMLCVGLGFGLAGRNAGARYTGRRESSLAVTLTWLLLTFCGMMPYLLGGYAGNVTDAFYEAMAGFTTTGSTIFRDVEALPHGILFWRSLTQWQGGVGIIVFTVALLPLVGGGANQLFDAEMSGIMREHFLPRITQIAKRFFGIYLLITCVLTLLLWAGPMNLFDAVNHAMTTVSSGGYSTKNDNVAFWGSSYIYYIICIFMFVAAMNFTLIYFLFSGRSHRIAKNEETRYLALFIIIPTLLMTAILFAGNREADLESLFREALFQVTSLITTTGYVVSDYAAWGTFFSLIVLILMTVCGCAGSTSGGLKMGRFIILLKNTQNEFKKLAHPNAVIPVRMNGQVIPSFIVQRVQTFAFIYLVLIIVGCAILLVDGLPFEESIGLAVSAVGNVGPALGRYTGAAFSDLSAVVKWTLAFLMLVGRLEIFTVLALFLPGFWRR